MEIENSLSALFDLIITYDNQLLINDNFPELSLFCLAMFSFG